MKNLKYTPGPWIVKFTGDKSIKLKQWDKLSPCDNDTHYEQINIHDARLIAAAPEMLEALQEFLDCGPNAGHNNELIDQVEAAVNKAKGGAK